MSSSQPYCLVGCTMLCTLLWVLEGLSTRWGVSPTTNPWASFRALGFSSGSLENQDFRQSQSQSSQPDGLPGAVHGTALGAPPAGPTSSDQSHGSGERRVMRGKWLKVPVPSTTISRMTEARSFPTLCSHPCSPLTACCLPPAPLRGLARQAAGPPRLPVVSVSVSSPPFHLGSRISLQGTSPCQLQARSPLNSHLACFKGN